MLHLKLLLIIAIGILLNVFPNCCGIRILGIFPINSRSHMMMFEQLMKELAKRGHQVDVVNTFPLKKPFPNYTDIVIPSTMTTLVNNMEYDKIQQFMKKTMIPFIAKEGGTDVCAKALKYPEIQRLIKNPPQDPPYDLVILTVSGPHCFLAFGPHLNVPMIGMSPTILYPWGHDFIANPENLAFVPNNMLEYMKNMNFWNRLYNVVHNTYIKLYFNYYTSPQNEMIKEHFGSNLPDVRELEQNLALILVNSHISLNGVKPTTPALIEVGGLHIQDDDTKIPAEDKKWLDESKDGFIYFTFGSMVLIESFPKHILEVLYRSFRKIAPVRVLMKVPQPKSLPPNLPINVRTFTWIPQLKVLKHKNIRAFITHGGLMSTQEAISCAVPMIGIPLFADQFLNIDLYVKNKIAVRLDYHALTEEKLDAALDEVLHNPVYRNTARKVSDKFLDRPLSPMDEACFWIEYVIRHGDKALRSPALDFSWWQIALLDIYLTLIIAGIIIVLSVISLVKFIINIITIDSSDISHCKKSN